MPRVIEVKGCTRPETILSPKDFEDLIDTHMGLECANYYQNQIEQLSECIRGLLTDYIDPKETLYEEIGEVLSKYGY